MGKGVTAMSNNTQIPTNRTNPIDINGDDTDNSINGGNADENIYGHGGNDTIFANEGSDYVFGGDGDDSLWTFMGDDVLIGDKGNDYLDGGDDNDTADYSGTENSADSSGTNGIIAEISAGSGSGLTAAVIDNWGGTDTLQNIESIIGSSESDVFALNGNMVDLAGQLIELNAGASSSGFGDTIDFNAVTASNGVIISSSGICFSFYKVRSVTPVYGRKIV